MRRTRRPTPRATRRGWGSDGRSNWLWLSHLRFHRRWFTHTPSHIVPSATRCLPCRAPRSARPEPGEQARLNIPAVKPGCIRPRAAPPDGAGPLAGAASIRSARCPFRESIGSPPRPRQVDPGITSGRALSVRRSTAAGRARMSACARPRTAAVSLPVPPAGGVSSPPLASCTSRAIPLESSAPLPAGCDRSPNRHGWVNWVDKPVSGCPKRPD